MNKKRTVIYIFRKRKGKTPAAADVIIYIYKREGERGKKFAIGRLGSILNRDVDRVPTPPPLSCELYYVKCNFFTAAGKE